MTASVSRRPKGVPAVLHTMAILEFLRERGNDPATMTEIARALGMNPSTCFNILKTLETGDLLACDPASKRYKLGPGLSELGAVVTDEGAVLSLARMRALEFVRRYKLILLICQKGDDDSFVVIDKLRGRPEPKGTAPLGSHLPPNGAVLAKAYYPWVDRDEVERMLELHGLPARTPMSITHVEEFMSQLDEVRERGYSSSIGEYDPKYNAAGAPVLGPNGRPVLLMIVTGHVSFMPERLIPAIGERLAAAASDVSKVVFQLPAASKETVKAASTASHDARHEGRSRRGPLARTDQGRTRAK